MHTDALAWLFQGQGTQKVGMGYELYQKSPTAQNLWKKANEVLGFDLLSMAFQGPVEQLTQTHFAQPAILTLGLCFVQTSNLKTPSYACGHSLGEYTALVAAEALSFEQAIWLVYQRGLAMQKATLTTPGSMVAILGLSAFNLEQICQTHNEQNPKEPVYVSNYNGPEQTVLSGHSQGLQHLIPLLKEQGAKKIIPLSVSAPFHCPLLKPAEEEFLVHLSQTEFKDAKYPLMSNTVLKPVQKSADIKEALKQQITSPVRFTEVIKKLIKLDVNHFVEFGSSKVLTSMMKNLCPQAKMELCHGP